MKTVTLNMYLEKYSIKAFFEGIRWDEAGSRASETYFSPRAGTKYSPEHMRVCPILHFTERDVWDAFHQCGIPILSLYREGYRSLGARVTTKKLSDIPAWEQDLENTTERGGRRQDKENLMAKLRELGYM
jgi:phosphoadenosine phosphosulfate reductase